MGLGAHGDDSGHVSEWEAKPDFRLGLPLACSAAATLGLRAPGEGGGQESKGWGGWAQVLHTHTTLAQLPSRRRRT